MEDEYPDEPVRTINIRDIRANSAMKHDDQRQYPNRPVSKDYRTATVIPDMEPVREPVNLHRPMSGDFEQINIGPRSQRPEPLQPRRPRNTNARSNAPVFIEDE